MDFKSPALDRLVAELQKLPGIGSKTAERLAHHIVRSPSEDSLGMADAIRDVKETVTYCRICYNFAEGELCSICADPARDGSKICIVEQVRDLYAIERRRDEIVRHLQSRRNIPAEKAQAMADQLEEYVERMYLPAAAHGVRAAAPDEAELIGMMFEREVPGTSRGRPFDVEMDMATADFGFVLNQDVEVLRNAQTGVHQPGFTHLNLSSEEVRIINLHRNLERYIGLDPSEMTGGPA